MSELLDVVLAQLLEYFDASESMIQTTMTLAGPYGNGSHFQYELWQTSFEEM